MSQIEKYCINYKNFERIGIGRYSNIYKTQNKNSGKYVAIKEIDKSRFKMLVNEKYDTEIKNIMNNEYIVKLTAKINTRNYFYIIMDLCIINLYDYIKNRENYVTIKEIKEMLNQLNNIFKIMNNKKIIHGDLKPTNILISLDKLDKCSFKLSDFNSSQFNNNAATYISVPSVTMPPEILKGENYNFKSDIWSLGIIIYFMLNKEYPYNGLNELLLFKDINSGKKDLN